MRLDYESTNNQETLKALIACYQRQIEQQSKSIRAALDLPRTALTLCKARSIMRETRRTRKKMHDLKKELHAMQTK